MSKRSSILLLLIIGFSIESNSNSIDYIDDYINHLEDSGVELFYNQEKRQKEFEEAQGEPVVGFVYAKAEIGDGERFRVKCLFKKDQMMLAGKYPLENGGIIEAGTVFKVGQSFDNYPPLTKREILEVIYDSIQNKLEVEKNISIETDDNFMNTLFTEITTVLIDLGYTVEVRSDGTVMIDNIVM